MSSVKRQKNTQIITYSRKTYGKATPRVPAGQAGRRTTNVTDESSRAFWDFWDSSDEEERTEKAATLINVAKSPELPLKRKSSKVVTGTAEKKLLLDRNVRSRSSTPIALQPLKQGSEDEERLQLQKSITPQKSNLTARSSISTTIPADSAPKTPPPPSAPSRSATPKTRPPVQTSTSPRPSLRQSVTPTKQPLSRVHSSPLSTSLSTRDSAPQRTPSTPSSRRSSGLRTRSHTSNDPSSPKMTFKQEQTWLSLPTTDETSPSRRRVVDKLREQVSRTPDRAYTPPPISDPLPTPSAIEDEISRILDYGLPDLDQQRSRKELSQSDSQGTYLSRTRSILAEPSMKDPFALAGLEDLLAPEAGNEDMQEEEEENSGVRSWHELKRGGEDKRLLDEMEDLIEDSKIDGRLGVRRSSVLQIVEKLLKDVAWRRKFKALGLMSTFIQNVADSHSDPILLLLTLIAIDLVPKPVPPTVSDEVLRLCLAGLLERRDLGILLPLRSLGVSKILKTELLSLHDQVSTAQILPKPLSPRNLALDIIVDLYVPDIRPICAYLHESDEEGQWHALAAISKSLEKSTQGKLVTGLKDYEVEIFSPILQKGLSEFETDVVLRKATLSVLRVCINLTNSGGEVCEYLSPDTSLSTALTQIITSDVQRYSNVDYCTDTKPNDEASLTEEDHEIKESRFEVLMLSLGLMINFVQESDKVKDMVIKSKLANNIRKFFEKLISREEPTSHALGYLALLLAHLIIPSANANAISVSHSTKEWVERLLDDFVGINRVVQSQSQNETERKDVEGMAGEIERVLLLLRAQ